MIENRGHNGSNSNGSVEISIYRMVLHYRYVTDFFKCRPRNTIPNTSFTTPFWIFTVNSEYPFTSYEIFDDFIIDESWSTYLLPPSKEIKLEEKRIFKPTINCMPNPNCQVIWQSEFWL